MENTNENVNDRSKGTEETGSGQEKVRQYPRTPDEAFTGKDTNSGLTDAGNPIANNPIAIKQDVIEEDIITEGELIIGIRFKHGNNDEVQNAKEHAAHLINSINRIADKNKSSRHHRLIALAKTAVEEASMWATKAKFTE